MSSIFKKSPNVAKAGNSRNIAGEFASSLYYTLNVVIYLKFTARINTYVLQTDNFINLLVNKVAYPNHSRQMNRIVRDKYFYIFRNNTSCDNKILIENHTVDSESRKISKSQKINFKIST